MSFSEISRALGRYLFYFSLILLIPLTVAAIYEYGIEREVLNIKSTWAFFKTMLICFALALIFFYFGKKAAGILHRKESIVLVSLIWILTAGISALPFIFSKALPSPLDAYFESMSGLTTTGSTVIYPVDAIGKGLLFWRSFLQWLGGMGIVVLFIAVFPALSMGGKFLFEAEVPGPKKETITPRIKETASLLWKIYLGLTAIQVAFLMIFDGNLPFFDALTLSFSTISTGGFNISSTGFGFYPLSTQCILIIFMILGGINFSIYFHILRGKIYRIYEPELIVYLAILIFGSLFVTLTLWNAPPIGEVFSFSKALIYGCFQAISAQTSTGFSIENYGLWPFTSQVLLLILIYIGGMSGSTAGGIKVARIYILFRAVSHKVESIFRPHAVRHLRIGEKEISDKTAISVFVFFCILIFLTGLGTFLLVLDGNDPQTSLGVISCCINNAGLVFGNAQMNESCAFLPPLSKVVSILWMLLGRLEFFAVLVFFIPSFWSHR